MHLYSILLLDPVCLSTTEVKRKETQTHLQFTVLCSVMKWGSSPVVSGDLSAVQQQPAEHLSVTSTGCEVHGRGLVTVPVRQADLCETHLQGGGTTIRVKGSGSNMFV